MRFSKWLDTDTFQISWDVSVCITFVLSLLSSHYMWAIRHRPCKHHILSAPLEISSHFLKAVLMFMCWKQSILVTKSIGTIYVLYPWFPDFVPCGPEKLRSLLVAGATLGCWSYGPVISLHHSLYSQKVPTKSFLFPFGHLPLIFSASGMHKHLCFCVCRCFPKFILLLEMGATGLPPSCAPVRFGPSSGRVIF